MKIAFPSSEIRQGSIIHAKLFVTPDSLNLPLQELKGEIVSETLYFQQLSQLFKKERSPEYVSEIQVIFIKVPEASTLKFKIGEEVVELGWNNIQVIPVETPEELLWADFTAPDLFKGKLIWVWFVLLGLLISVFGIYAGKKISVKNAQKARKRRLIDEFKSCQTYDEIVSMWKKKRTYTTEFPHLSSAFQPFEEVLFRYQFKPTQTEIEKSEVLNAYRKLLDQGEGGFRGI
jgi:hypothetical protein